MGMVMIMTIHKPFCSTAHKLTILYNLETGPACRVPTFTLKTMSSFILLVRIIFFSGSAALTNIVEGI